MLTAETAHRMYRFGEFSLDLDRGTLYRGQREIHLRPKAFRVLRILLENNGRLVSKAELHDAVWKKSVVTDDSLAHCIADVRRALGDSDFEIIKTVPRRGYVFDHAVSHEITDPPETPPQRTRFVYQLGTVATAVFAIILLLLGAGQSAETPGAGDEAGEYLLATTTGVDRPVTDIDAFNEYEKGRFFFKRRGKGDIERAEACFKAALQGDPDLAGAWVGLAGVYSVRMGYGDLSRETGVALLGDATRQAIRLAPDSAEAHLRRAHYYNVLGKTSLARQHMETAMALDPDDILALGWAAGNHAHRGLFAEAIKLQRRAVQEDPTSALSHHNLVWFLLAGGRNAEAAAAAEEYRAIYPPGLGDEGELFVDVEILQGNYEQALVHARDMANGPTRDRNLAVIHHALGQEAEADTALRRLLAAGDEQARVHAAEVFAQRGETDEAMRLLVDVLKAPEGELPHQHRLRHDTLSLLSPYLIGLRSDARWQALYADVLEAREFSTRLARAGSSGVSGSK
jgi:DNA-binding winged helix-turn-helix (wHTH) protein/Tfp pilus assembly protein PilF